jgi:hypothetical protein
VRARIALPDFWDQINTAFGTSGGVYKVSCLREDGLEPVPVSRLLGQDPEGVLYIGMAASFLDRVIELKKSLSPQHVSRGHECGARHKRHEGIASAFPYERLAVTFMSADAPRVVEQQALAEYFSHFGELPPSEPCGLNQGGAIPPWVCCRRLKLTRRLRRRQQAGAPQLHCLDGLRRIKGI